MLARSIAVALVLVALVGCESCEEDAAPEAPAAAATSRAPVEPPEDLTFEATLGGGASALRQVRRLLGSHPARLLMPGSPGELVDRMIETNDVTLADRIADDAPIYTIGVETGWAVAVPIRRDEDPAHPLGAEMPIVAGAPEGGVWVGAEPQAPSDAAAALVGDVLVLSENQEALRRTLPYAAFTMATRETRVGLSARLAGHVATELRGMLEALLDRAVGEALANVREERARHDAAPDFGEPEAVIEHAARLARVWLSYLPDIGPVDAVVTIEDGVATATLNAAVREGSPLSLHLEETPAGGVSEIGALPGSTAFAISTRSAPGAESRFSFLRAFEDVAGDRLSTPERAAIGALGAAWEEARGAETILAGGGGAEDAWLVTSLPGPRAELQQSAIASVVGARFSASLLGIVFDCARAPRPRIGDQLCPDAPALSFARAEARTVFGIGRDTEAARAVAESQSGSFSSEPDLARALGALGDQLVFSMVLIPSRIMPLAGLSGSEPLQQLSRVSSLAARPAPIALGIGKTEEGLEVRLVASDRAIEDAMGLVGSF